MKIKKISCLVLATSMIMGLVGCGKTVETTSTDNKKPIEIVFWHAMAGVNGQGITTLVENFNKSNKEVHVTAQFQGTYDDELTKLKTAMQGKAGPDVCQVYDIGSRYMIDGGWVVPVQKYIDSDKYDKTKIEPNLLSYYTIDSKLWSMPFNSSTPILYYNKTAFKEAGLDPNVAPKTFKEVEEYAAKLVKKDNSGNITQYGFSMAIYGWFFEQLIAKQGQLYANNNNGRTDRATAVEFEKNGAGLNILKEWQTLIKSGNVGNFGRKTDDTKNAFSAGRSAMILESTGALNGLTKGAGGRFEIGTAFIPTLNDAKDGGVIIGGGSLWMIDNKNTDKEKATWEFIKYMSQPEQQVFWSKTSGYFPTNVGAYDLEEMKTHLKANPNFQTAVDQLHQTPTNYNTQGACVGVFSEARSNIETNIEKMLQNKQTPEETIKTAATTINSAIDNYNKTNTK
ncbi:ABC transporter substrate-binding protein [Clostridium sp.]